MARQPITLIATATFGLEAVVKRELKGLGFTSLTVTDGKVEVEATAAAGGQRAEASATALRTNSIEILSRRWWQRDADEVVSIATARYRTHV